MVVATVNNNNDKKNNVNTTSLKMETATAQTQIVSARVRKTIQSIKEIVGKAYSDADIYVTLKETNMDPNETTQKLLNQDPFHVVKSKRDKKKENVAIGFKGSADSRKPYENSGLGQGVRYNSSSDRNTRRGSYARNTLPDTGINREFRVVRDNRVNGNTTSEVKPPSLQLSASTNERANTNTADKSNLTVTPGSHKFSVGRSSFQASNGQIDLPQRHGRDAKSAGTARKEAVEEKRTGVSNVVSRAQTVKPNNSQTHTATLASNKDPVHVPSPDRSPAAIGAIKREVGVVGVRRLSIENAAKSQPSNSISNSVLAKDSATESLRPFHAASKADQLGQATVTESTVPPIPVGKPFLSNQYGSRLHQQVAGNQKASLPNKEWKPKSSQKSIANGPGVIGTPKKSVSSSADCSKDVESGATKLTDKVSQIEICDDNQVIIAHHIRVPETDRCQLTFGTFGPEFDSSRSSVSDLQAAGPSEDLNGDSAASLPAGPESSSNDTSGSKPHVDKLDDQARKSGSNSPVSGAVSEQQLPDKDSSSPQDLQNYADIGLIQEHGPSYGGSDSQQQQDAHELPNFSAYDPQSGYDIPYFSPAMDEPVRGLGVPSPQESLASHSANSIPASTIPMAQQQQQQAMAQMYPQVHVSHYGNLMPYRQFLSPVYLPQMAMPAYSSNPAYPHPPNGSSYVLMPGGSSHIGANVLKYGIQQYKPVPAGNPTGFGNFTGPTGYALSAPGVVGSGAGLEESSRMKYKDGNLFVPNPQAETSEIWIQNPRDVPGMQSASYYNMPGQTPHPYMPSHTGHASFNAAAAQSTHMQFPGMYHTTPQPPAMAGAHHLTPAMGGSVGVGVAPAAPGAQVGAYQQPQLGHVNWTSNF